ncbi:MULTISPECIES: hypothetical protein [Klebsiella]|uniref:hypothetical protein n=1 Tax=Klebsiella TaxID=570 RepID=UPI00306C0C5A
MTSKLTREQAEIRSFIIGFLSDPAHDNQSANSMTSKVFRIALAVIDSKPIGWTDEEELRDVDVAGIGYLFKLDAAPGFDPRRQILLIQAPEVNV